MRIKIYQLNPSKESLKQRIIDSKEMENINSSAYNQVFNAVIDETTPLGVMAKINSEGHPLYIGGTISPSDVITVGETSYLCQRNGFREISFDVSLTHKPRDLMRVVYKEPKKPAFETEIRNELYYLQKAVGGGLIETVKISNDKTLLIDNEESKIMGMEGNIRFGDGSSIIAGPFFICGEKNCDFRGLTDAEAEKYLKLFSVPEEISQEEVEADMFYQIIGLN